MAILNGVNKWEQILSHIRQQLNEDGTKVAQATVSLRVCFSETNVHKVLVIGYNTSA